MFVEMSKNILTHKSKIIGNFSTREVVCGGIGALIALGIGFSGTIKGSDMTLNEKVMVSFLFALPFFLIGFVKLYGQPLEKILPIIIYDNFIVPLIRPYKTEYIIEEKKKLKGLGIKGIEEIENKEEVENKDTAKKESSKKAKKKKTKQTMKNEAKAFYEREKKKKSEIKESKNKELKAILKTMEKSKKQKSER